MESKEKNFVSAVIYVHNADGRIGEFLAMAIRILEGNFEHSEIICVNDCSGDGSIEEIRAASGQADKVSVSILNMSYYHGLELAMNAGRDLAIGDFVFEFDDVWADYGGDEVMGVYRRALEGYDVVSAVPDGRQRFSSQLFYHLFDRSAGMPYQMRTESFRILSRRVINRIGSMNRTVPYRKAVYANCGLKISNIVYHSAQYGGGNGQGREEISQPFGNGCVPDVH